MANIFTMSSVRREDGRRSVPLDAVTFLAEAYELGKKRLQPEQNKHIVGDVSILAVEVARDSANVRETIRRLRVALLDDKPEPIEAQLGPIVDEKVRLIRSMVRAVGLNIEVSSAIKFLRENKQLAGHLLDELAVAFSSTSSSSSVSVFDINEMEDELRGVDRGSNHVLATPSLVRMNDVALATLPQRLRSLSPIEQQQQSLYAAMEGFLAGRLIEEGDTYLTYRGSEIAKGQPTIIEKMKLLVKIAAYFALQDTPRAKRIEDAFVIDPIMDGIGFSGHASVRCAPHTMDSSSGVQRLPLLIFENGRLRAVTADEFSSAARTGTGGISGAKIYSWLHNLGTIVGVLSDDHSQWPTEIRDVIAESDSVSEEEIKEWVVNAKRHVRRDRDGQSSQKLEPLIPGGDFQFTSKFVSAIARVIEKGMYNESDGSAN